MKLFGVMGFPVGHSASPAMMNRAFKHSGIDAVYTSFRVAPEQARQAFEGLAALGATGVNVTIPHKVFAYEWVDELTPEARKVGAVNTVRFHEHGTVGHNTDVGGWWRSIEQYVPTKKPQITLIGAGGAARAIVSAISIHRQDADVSVIARRSTAVDELQRTVQDGIALKHIPWDQRATGIADSPIVIQTTPIGMWPNEDQCVVEDKTVFSSSQIIQDIVYRPQQTKFLQLAEEEGAITLNGVAMLVYQGALAYEWWLAEDAPTEQMFDAVHDFLAAEHQHV